MYDQNPSIKHKSSFNRFDNPPVRSTKKLKPALRAGFIVLCVPEDTATNCKMTQEHLLLTLLNKSLH
jgi:hypothetical protein